MNQEKIVKQIFKQMHKEDFEKPSFTIINLAQDLLEKGDLQGGEHWEEQISQRTIRGDCKIMRDVKKIEKLCQKESKKNSKYPKTFKAIKKFSKEFK